MFGSSLGEPNCAHAIASSPSNTNAACAPPSLTSRFLSAWFPSAVNVFSAWNVWNHVHQQPPNTPLCRSTRRENASQVSGPSGSTL
jgi:hypothetical protein